MDIIVKDYSYITEFINRNRGKLTEAQMATVIKTQLDAEFASELTVEEFMVQAKPKTMLGERLIAEYGSLDDFVKDLSARAPKLAALFILALIAEEL